MKVNDIINSNLNLYHKKPAIQYEIKKEKEINNLNFAEILKIEYAKLLYKK